jgi:Ca-activated chloride channel family protein
LLRRLSESHFDAAWGLATAIHRVVRIAIAPPRNLMAQPNAPQDGNPKDGNPNGRRLGELLGTPGGRSRKSLPLPLIAVSVRAAITCDCACSELEERFGNPHDRPLDVTHTFPLPPGGAVVAFEIMAGGRCVKGVCKRIERVKADFASARKRGKTAAMVESVRDDLHVVSLANVPPRTEVTVKLTVVERLRCDEGRFEYRFPTTISPKFTPGAKGDQAEVPATGDSAGDSVGLSPPMRLAGGVPFHFEAMVPTGVIEVGGSVEFSRVEAKKGLVRLRPLAGLTCNGDLVLRMSARGETPGLRAFTDGERTLVIVDPPARRKPELEAPRIATFLIDRSGSMAGERLDAAKRAVTEAIRAIGPNDRFEIVAFDDEFEVFSEGPVAATPARIDEATTWLASLAARGGTEALPALRHACRTPPPAGSVRTVLLVTDGCVGNDGELIGFTRSLDPATRLYTIGIGDATFRSLIDRIARIGGGTNLFLKDSDDIRSEIARFDAALAGPMACGLGEEGSGATGIRDLFAGRAAIFFLEGPRSQVRITSVDGRFTGDCEVHVSPMPLGALWARERVLELEDRIVERPADREVLEAKVAQIAVKYSIQTRLTAFIAIDENSQVVGDSIEVEQPVEAPRDMMCSARSAPTGGGRHESGVCFSAPDVGRTRSAARSFARHSREIPDPVSLEVRAAAERIVRTRTAWLAAGSPGALSLDEGVRLLLAILIRKKPVDSELAKAAIEAVRIQAAGLSNRHFLDAVAARDLEAAIRAARTATGVMSLQHLLGA